MSLFFSRHLTLLDVVPSAAVVDKRIQYIVCYIFVMELTEEHAFQIHSRMMRTHFILNTFNADVTCFARQFTVPSDEESLNYLRKYKEDHLGVRYLHIPVSKTWHFLNDNMAHTM